MKTMVSVIIPTFNSKRFIGSCLESICCQKKLSIEILCIDDGSTDETVDIIKSYMEYNPNIILIRQDNQGAAVARNVGLDCAKGKYVLFVDSDDYLESNSIELLVSRAEIDRSDILVYGNNKIDWETEKIVDQAEKTLRVELFGDDVRSSKELGVDAFMFGGTCIWNKFYLRSFLEDNNLRFSHMRKMEDLSFSLISIAKANRISILDSKLYNYRVNNSYSVQGTISDTPTIFIDALLDLKNRLIEANLNEHFREAYNKMACWNILYSMNLLDKTSYISVQTKLASVFMPELDIIDLMEALNVGIKEFLDGFSEVNNLTVYGAGMLGKCMIKYTQVKECIKQENIELVVSDIKNNNAQLFGKTVRCFESVEHNISNPVVIAVENKKTQAEIRQILESKGYERIFSVGYFEMLYLIAYGD